MASPVENVYILSPLQQGLLYHALLAPEAGLYVDQTVLDLEGEIEAGALAGALRYGVARHPALRSSFHWQELERPVQVVHPPSEVPLRVEDWRGEDPAGRRERLEAWLTEDRRRGFDLSQPPLLRYTLIRTGERESLLVSTFHHILLDGWSSAVLLSDLLYAYEELARGRTPHSRPVRPFSDYIGWLRRQDLQSAEAFWRSRLNGVSAAAPLGLGSRNGHRPFETGHGERTITLPPEATAALRAFAGRHELTLNTLVQGAWALLLHRYSGEPEVVFGATVAGRPEALPGVESMVGLFINTLPVRVPIPAGEGLVPWLRGIQRWLVEAHPYEHSPLAEIQRWSGLPAGAPLFETIVAFESLPEPEVPDLSRPVAVRGSRYVSRTHYPLSLLVRPEESLSIQATYDRGRFSEAEVARLLEQLAGLLTGFVESPAVPVDRRTVLDAAEVKQALRGGEGAAVELSEVPLHALVEAQVERAPEAVAVVSESLQVTYRELWNRAAGLARHLEKMGVGPEVPVVTSVERSPDAIVALLGVLAAGGVYVPADPGSPAERIDFLIQDTGAPVVVESPLAGMRDAPPPLLRVRASGAASRSGGAPRTPASPSPGNLAWVIYTSGSTGRPKGVGVTHGVAAAHAGVAAGVFGIGERDRVLQFTSHAFDAALEQIFVALTRGATLVLRGEEVWEPGDLSARLRRLGVTVANFPSSYWGRWAQEAPEEVAGLRLVIAGGEAMDPAWAESWQGARLLNAYGPTEGVVTANVYEVPRPFAGHSVPLGRPLPGRKAYVLDARLDPVPFGVPGELCLGGPLLARGYLGRPDLTAAAFVPDPFATETGARLYRTGDRVRAVQEGFEFLGRVDRQLKVRGFRIEPGEIEAALERHPGVREAAVELRTDLPGGPALVAWIAGEEITVRGLRTFLGERLPAALVPGHFAFLDALPRTPGAKVDRRALSRLEVGVQHSEETATPRTPVEELLVEIWRAVLGIERIGVHDDFLELGGHSLLATLLLSRVREAFRVDLPLASLFEAPTVAGQAERVERALREGVTDATPPLVPVDRSRPLPLSFAQQRLWILDQLNPGLPAYNIPLAVRLRGPLSPAKLQAAITAVAARHESLRTRFEQVAGDPVQRIEPPSLVPLPVIDLSAVGEGALFELAHAETARRFDLARGPLLRAALLRLDEEDWTLLLTVHHAVADGWSIGILFRELAAFYSASPPLPPLPVQYADYAVWQRSWLQGEILERQLAYWRERLAGLPAGLELPTDRPRPALRSSNGSRLHFALEAAEWAAVRSLARAERATPFMVLLAAFQELLGRYSGRDDLTVGTPVANRNRVETEGLIGFFVNTLVLRADLGGEPAARRLVARARDTTLAAYTHQDVPFEKLVEELQPERSLAWTPLFQVLLSWESPPPPPRLPGLIAEPVDAGSELVKFDLALALADGPEGIAGALEYNTDLFDPATAARMLGHFRTLLAGFTAHPERTAASLPVLPQAEIEQLLSGWNDVQAPAPDTLHRLFAGQTVRTPEATAVAFAGDPLTYAELDARANQLAHRLRALGVGPEVPVGLFLERTLEMVVAVLGVLKAGGAYVPLDPAYPEERLAWTLEDCRAPVILTQEWLADRLPEGPERLFLDASWEALEGWPEEPPADLAALRNLAYLIYTSGSTGRPKGVAIEHRSAAALLAWARETFSAAELSAVLASTSICFDLSVFELFAPLTCGGRVVLVDSALDLLTAGGTARVSLVNTVPSAAAELVRAGALPPSVRTLNLAGEPIPAALVERLAAQPGLEKVWNLYGPSEATTYSTAFQVLPGSDVQRQPPIGRPIAGTAALVLDRRLRPVPEGVAGELYLAGAGLARGYFGRPDLTAASFLPHPYAVEATAGGRVYKTGDLVRRLPGGGLEFLGRVDHQVKVRGFRIELGEVESALERHPGIAQAAAAVREDVPGDRRLVAYVVPKNGEAPAADELRAELQRTLPEYMLPSLFVALPALPLNANGKVDRAVLPAPETVRPRTAYAEPETELERAVAGVIATALGVERVGRHDNFFDLGGHSLLMIRAAGLIEERIGRKVQVIELFRFPTVAALAGWLAGSGEEVTLPARERIEQRKEARREGGRDRRREIRQGLR